MSPIAVLGAPKNWVFVFKLVMFEDMFCCCWQVDVLFEERGFWSAVYELIATTKRPIIMTCNGEWRGGEGRVVEEGGGSQLFLSLVRDRSWFLLRLLV